MGKSWDNSGIAYSVPMWRECLRVLKPGGHLLSFSGTRTYHRMAVAIEDAGFEIRDMIEWVYGSGFPKSLNIGKAVDKRGGTTSDQSKEFAEYIKNRRTELNITLSKADEVICGGTTNYSWFEGRPAGQRLPRKSDYLTMKELLKLDNRYDSFMEETERELLKIDKNWGEKSETATFTGGQEWYITKGNSEWEGWGTALKPSHESIMLAQKPLTSVPLFDKIDIDLIIKKILCLLVSNVKIAESNLVLSQHGLSEELNIAQWIAEENTNTQDALYVLTDIFLSESKTNTNLNIVILWLNILEDLYQLKNKFTTLTEISLTIELKILESLEWENIFQNITQAKDKKTDGKNVNVLTAVNLFNAVRLKLNHILTHFAQDPAILKDEYSDIRPKHEPICMARKPLSEKTVAENVLKYGTGGINIDESRVDGTEEVGRDNRNIKNSPLAPKDGWNENSMKGLDTRGNTKRFPANLIHDNSEEVRECFPDTKGAKETTTRVMENPPESWKQSSNVRNINSFSDSGNASRFFKSILYYPKASRSDRNKDCDILEDKPAGMAMKDDKFTREHMGNTPASKREPVKNNHPTVKPTALMSYLIKMITPKGGIVLEPFAGSGSTLVAARDNGFKYIGIELTEEYLPIIQARTGCEIIKNTKDEVKVVNEIKEVKPKQDLDKCPNCNTILKKTKYGMTCEDCLNDY